MLNNSFNRWGSDRVIHFQGKEEKLEWLVNSLFDIVLDEISLKLK